MEAEPRPYVIVSLVPTTSHHPADVHLDDGRASRLNHRPIPLTVKQNGLENAQDRFHKRHDTF